MLYKQNKSTTLMFATLILVNMFEVESQTYNRKMIYILHWTKPGILYPMEYWKSNHFKFMNCEYQNCIFTNTRNYFEDVTDFDVILFDSIYISQPNIDLPSTRSDDQIYIFASPESAANYPTKGDTFNWFFNYTWTYKLNSDIPYPYIVARNKNGEVIAPGFNVKWLDVNEMENISESIKDRLKNKRKAVAWFVSDCQRARIYYAWNLQRILKNYNLELDIYGQCGDFDCAREIWDYCLDKIESEYYFYLAFENSFSEDYVTEKVLSALDHFAVPIVLGGGDYSRFMPEGIYLNANMGEEKLADKIHEIISDKEQYYNFFRWQPYYSFHHAEESADSDPLCALCRFLNSDWRNQRRVYAKFSDWWNEYQHPVPQNVTNDTIVYYKLPDSKTRYIYERPEVNLKTNDESSMINGVGEFVNMLYNYVFQS